MNHTTSHILCLLLPLFNIVKSFYDSDEDYMALYDFTTLQESSTDHPSYYARRASYGAFAFHDVRGVRAYVFLEGGLYKTFVIPECADLSQTDALRQSFARGGSRELLFTIRALYSDLEVVCRNKYAIASELYKIYLPRPLTPPFCRQPTTRELEDDTYVVNNSYFYNHTSATAADTKPMLSGIVSALLLIISFFLSLLFPTSPTARLFSRFLVSWIPSLRSVEAFTPTTHLPSVQYFGTIPARIVRRTIPVTGFQPLMAQVVHNAHIVKNELQHPTEETTRAAWSVTTGTILMIVALIVTRNLSGMASTVVRGVDRVAPMIETEPMHVDTMAVVIITAIAIAYRVSTTPHTPSSFQRFVKTLYRALEALLIIPVLLTLAYSRKYSATTCIGLSFMTAFIPHPPIVFFFLLWKTDSDQLTFAATVVALSLVSVLSRLATRHIGCFGLMSLLAHLYFYSFELVDSYTAIMTDAASVCVVYELFILLVAKACTDSQPPFNKGPGWVNIPYHDPAVLSQASAAFNTYDGSNLGLPSARRALDTLIAHNACSPTKIAIPNNSLSGAELLGIDTSTNTDQSYGLVPSVKPAMFERNLELATSLAIVQLINTMVWNVMITHVMPFSSNSVIPFSDFSGTNAFQIVSSNTAGGRLCLRQEAFQTLYQRATDNISTLRKEACLFVAMCADSVRVVDQTRAFDPVDVSSLLQQVTALSCLKDKCVTQEHRSQLLNAVKALPIIGARYAQACSFMETETVAVMKNIQARVPAEQRLAVQKQLSQTFAMRKYPINYSDFAKYVSNYTKEAHSWWSTLPINDTVLKPFGPGACVALEKVRTMGIPSGSLDPWPVLKLFDLQLVEGLLPNASAIVSALCASVAPFSPNVNNAFFGGSANIVLKDHSRYYLDDEEFDLLAEERESIERELEDHMYDNALPPTNSIIKTGQSLKQILKSQTTTGLHSQETAILVEHKTIETDSVAGYYQKWGDLPFSKGVLDTCIEKLRVFITEHSHSQFFSDLSRHQQRLVTDYSYRTVIFNAVTADVTNKDASGGYGWGNKKKGEILTDPSLRARLRTMVDEFFVHDGLNHELLKNVVNTVFSKSDFHSQKKVLTGNIRTIQVPPIHYSMFLCMITYGTKDHVYALPGFAVVTNTNDVTQATILANQIGIQNLTNDSFMFTGDYKNYDRNQHPEISSALVDMLTPGFDRDSRKAVFDSLCKSPLLIPASNFDPHSDVSAIKVKIFHEVNGSIYRTNGTTSGNDLTTYLNNLLARLLHIICAYLGHVLPRAIVMHASDDVVGVIHNTTLEEVEKTMASYKAFFVSIGLDTSTEFQRFSEELPITMSFLCRKFVLVPDISGLRRIALPICSEIQRATRTGFLSSSTPEQVDGVKLNLALTARIIKYLMPLVPSIIDAVIPSALVGYCLSICDTHPVDFDLRGSRPLPAFDLSGEVHHQDVPHEAFTKTTLYTKLFPKPETSTAVIPNVVPATERGRTPTPRERAKRRSSRSSSRTRSSVSHNALNNVVSGPLEIPPEARGYLVSINSVVSNAALVTLCIKRRPRLYFRVCTHGVPAGAKTAVLTEHSTTGQVGHVTNLPLETSFMVYAPVNCAYAIYIPAPLSYKATPQPDNTVLYVNSAKVLCGAHLTRVSEHPSTKSPHGFQDAIVTSDSFQFDASTPDGEGTSGSQILYKSSPYFVESTAVTTQDSSKLRTTMALKHVEVCESYNIFGSMRFDQTRDRVSSTTFHVSQDQAAKRILLKIHSQRILPTSVTFVSTAKKPRVRAFVLDINETGFADYQIKTQLGSMIVFTPETQPPKPQVVTTTATFKMSLLRHAELHVHNVWAPAWNQLFLEDAAPSDLDVAVALVRQIFHVVLKTHDTVLLRQKTSPWSSIIGHLVGATKHGVVIRDSVVEVARFPNSPAEASDFLSMCLSGVKIAYSIQQACAPIVDPRDTSCSVSFHGYTYELARFLVDQSEDPPLVGGVTYYRIPFSKENLVKLRGVVASLIRKLQESERYLEVGGAIAKNFTQLFKFMEINFHVNPSVATLGTSVDLTERDRPTQTRDVPRQSDTRQRTTVKNLAFSTAQAQRKNQRPKPGRSQSAVPQSPHKVKGKPVQQKKKAPAPGPKKPSNPRQANAHKTITPQVRSVIEMLGCSADCEKFNLIQAVTGSVSSPIAAPRVSVNESGQSYFPVAGGGNQTIAVAPGSAVVIVPTPSEEHPMSYFVVPATTMPLADGLGLQFSQNDLQIPDVVCGINDARAYSLDNVADNAAFSNANGFYGSSMTPIHFSPLGNGDPRNIATVHSNTSFSVGPYPGYIDADTHNPGCFQYSSGSICVTVNAPYNGSGHISVVTASSNPMFCGGLSQAERYQEENPNKLQPSNATAIYQAPQLRIPSTQLAAQPYNALESAGRPIHVMGGGLGATKTIFMPVIPNDNGFRANAFVRHQGYSADADHLFSARRRLVPSGAVGGSIPPASAWGNPLRPFAQGHGIVCVRNTSSTETLVATVEFNFAYNCILETDPQAESQLTNVLIQQAPRTVLHSVDYAKITTPFGVGKNCAEARAMMLDEAVRDTFKADRQIVASMLEQSTDTLMMYPQLLEGVGAKFTKSAIAPHVSFARAIKDHIPPKLVSEAKVALVDSVKTGADSVASTIHSITSTVQSGLSAAAEVTALLALL